MEKKMNFTIQKLSIPQEIIFEIFSWLPVKSLMRFKCVSRFASSLVLESDFVDMHSYRGETKFLLHEAGVCYAAEQKKDGKCFASLLQIERFNELYQRAPACSHLNCLNGLFCVWSSFYVQSAAAIFNPITRELRFLPDLNGDFYRYNYSLGFEPKGKKYKVLVTTCHIHAECFKNWVFTLDQDKSWRETQSISACIMYCKPNVCVSGVIYQFARSNNYYSAIAAFDVKSEKFEIIALWNAIELEYYWELTEVKGNLAIIDYKRWLHDYNNFDLWILQQTPKKEWKRCIISVPLMSSNIKTRLASSFMARDREIVFAFILKSGALCCLCYNITRKSWRELKIEGLSKESNINGIYSYVESLIIPFG